MADETGYPLEMLDLDLDLEADLGIDTVKQAEMFAAIRGEWDIERDDDLALRDYPTLRAVMGFVYERADGLGQALVVSPLSSVDSPGDGNAPCERLALELSERSCADLH